MYTCTYIVSPLGVAWDGVPGWKGAGRRDRHTAISMYVRCGSVCTMSVLVGLLVLGGSSRARTGRRVHRAAVLGPFSPVFACHKYVSVLSKVTDGSHLGQGSNSDRRWWWWCLLPFLARLAGSLRRTFLTSSSSVVPPPGTGTVAPYLHGTSERLLPFLSQCLLRPRHLLVIRAFHRPPLPHHCKYRWPGQVPAARAGSVPAGAGASNSPHACMSRSAL